jgi:hypothetical protein
VRRLPSGLRIDWYISILWRRIAAFRGGTLRMLDALKAYLHLREWSELRYVLDLPPTMLIWVGMIVVGAIGMWWWRPRR